MELINSFLIKNPTPCCFSFSCPLYKNLCPLSVVSSPVPNHLISDSPIISHLIRSSSLDSSSNFPHLLSILTFHVPIVVILDASFILFILVLLVKSPVANFQLLTWDNTMDSAVVVNPGYGRSRMLDLLLLLLFIIILSVGR